MEKSKVFRVFKSEMAQSVVEFTLLFPILILLLSLVVDVTRLVDAKILLQGATCEGASHVTDLSNDVNAQVFSAISDYNDRLDFTRLKIKTSNTAPIKRNYKHHAQSDGRFVELPCHYTYSYVTVAATYDAKLIMPFSNMIFGDTFRLKSDFTAQVYLEGYPET